MFDSRGKGGGRGCLRGRRIDWVGDDRVDLDGVLYCAVHCTFLVLIVSCRVMSRSTEEKREERKGLRPDLP